LNWNQTLAVMRKEFRHITRDRMSFSLTLVAPLLILVVFGYSFLVDVKDVPVVVVNHDAGSLSQRYLDALGSSNVLDLSQSAPDQAAATQRIQNGKAKLAVLIPSDFSEQLSAGTGLPLTILVDGSEPHAANVALTYINDETKSFLRETLAQLGGPPLIPPLNLKVEALFDPGLKPINGTMPGMIGMALSFVGVGVCAALTREKERGTFESLVATPIGRSELLVGKLLPYVGTGFIAIALCIVVAVFGFGVPFRGNVAVLVVLSFIFLFALMAYALLFSLFFQTQQAAMMVTVLVFMIPPFFLSGLFIPIIVMPWWIRVEAMLFPVTPFVEIMRGLFLRGYGLSRLWVPTLVLIGSGAGVMVLAIALFRKRIHIDWMGEMLARMPQAERRLLERWIKR
jgi:ABC-2 type transport system permease protein